MQVIESKNEKLTLSQADNKTSLLKLFDRIKVSSNHFSSLRNLNNQVSSSPRRTTLGALQLKSKLLFSIANQVESPSKRTSIQQSPHNKNQRNQDSFFPALLPQKLENTSQNESSDSSEENIQQQEEEIHLVENLDFFSPIKKTQNKFNQIILRIKQVQKPTFREDKQKSGINMIHFNQARSLIQPRFMEEKGSMCITELWPEQMKQELIKVNKTFDDQDVKLSRNIRMTKIDKDYTQSYKPRKMRENVDIQQKVQDDRQNMQLNQMTPDYVIKNYGLQKQTDNLKISIQKKLISRTQLKNEESKLQFTPHVKKPESPNNQSILNINRLRQQSTQSKHTNSKLTQILNKTKLSTDRSIGDNFELHPNDNTLNQSTLDSKQNYYIGQNRKNESINQYYNNSFSKNVNSLQSPRIQQRKFKTISNNRREAQQEYYFRQLIEDNNEGIKSKSFRKNYQDNSLKITKLIKIKGECENALENSLSIDSYLDKFNNDFNRKIDKLDKRIEKHR